MNTSTEDDTFKRLKRTPFEEMESHLKSIPRYSPMFNIGNEIFESRKPEIVHHYEQIKVLKAHGWDFEEYVLEIERRNILSAVDQFNRNNGFPMELVKRAQEFFPNAKFTQAKIELE